MKKAQAIFAILLSLASQLSFSEESSLTLNDILESYSNNNNVKIIADPKVKGKVDLFGQALDDITFSNLLTILNISGFTAYQRDGYVIVITKREARLNADKLGEGEHYPNQFLTDVIHLEKDCATKIIPILRPLIPQFGHLAASMTSNSIIITDTYANILRIEAIVKDLDSQLEKPAKCRAKK